MRLAGLWEDHGLVFPNETGRPLNPSNLRNRSFKRIKARSGVREDLRFHDLRHTCATLLVGEGVNPKVVSEMLGHASITITLNTYSHVLPDMQDRAAEPMEAALGTAMP
jgi:integrase